MTDNEFKENILRSGSIPRHIAFIMDGNGRWASKRGLPRIAGHRNGVKTVRRMVECGTDIGVKYMTFYAFSSENWRRPIFEVSALMDLLVDALESELDDMHKNNVRLKVIGEIKRLPKAAQNAAEKGIEKTKNNTGLNMIMAISYSGRKEIINAVNRILQSNVKEIDETTFPNFLDTHDVPDPDLLIRTSGEFRISNFLLYQLAYTEIVVTPRFWPEFNENDLMQCISEYQKRERRFGLISDQVSNAPNEK